MQKLSIQAKVHSAHNPVPIIFGLYIFHYHITYQLLNMLDIKHDNNQQDLKIFDLQGCISSNLNKFHSLEVVEPVSETQLQVSENSNEISWRSKG